MSAPAEIRYQLNAQDFDELTAALAGIRFGLTEKATSEQKSVRDVSCSELGLFAADLHRARLRRPHWFGGLFGEAAYDILLDLFAVWSADGVISVSSACLASGVPATTALRHIDVLCERSLIVRRPDPDDGRRHHLFLTPKGVDLMTRHLIDLKRTLG